LGCLLALGPKHVELLPEHGCVWPLYRRLARERVMFFRPIKWKFRELLCAMFDRFIRTATASAAQDKFEAVRFDASSGVVAFMTDLLDAGEQLMEPVSIGYKFASTK